MLKDILLLFSSSQTSLLSMSMISIQNELLFCLSPYILLFCFNISNRLISLQVLFFSTMTRLLDVMEEYLHWKQYRYLRLDGHTAGGDRGALIESFNGQNSPYFIFLLR